LNRESPSPALTVTWPYKCTAVEWSNQWDDCSQIKCLASTNTVAILLSNKCIISAEHRQI